MKKKPKSHHIGDPPPVLKGYALEVWNRTAPSLEEAGVGSAVEADALSCYCQAIADFHAAQEAIDRHGLVVQTERGFAKNPACTIKNQALLHIHKFATAFGLTPASHDRVTRTPPPEENPFADLLDD